MSTMNLGIDIGSTTAKIVLMGNGKIIYKKYQRHLSQVRATTVEMLKEMTRDTDIDKVRITVSGSAGMGMVQKAGIDFIQEVFATGEVVSKLTPETGVDIELGGEDAKVIFFDGGIDERMNGTCAGGTGSFIDQMTVLLNMTVDEMDEESLKAARIYPIASRCGVFAKTDIQPLLNQGASKADIAASIFQAVVNQTIAGLVQGRKINGKVMFLGGPLYYCKGLQKRFYETLKLTEDTAVFPDYALYSVAMGAAMYSENSKETSIKELIKSLEDIVSLSDGSGGRLKPLFDNEEEYNNFCNRHKKATVERSNIKEYSGNAWLGIDCGSTTTKVVLIGEDKKLLYTYYNSNKGNPVELILGQLKEIYSLCGDNINICGSAVTGYGEELIQHAFHVDKGIVETIEHSAAEIFQP